MTDIQDGIIRKGVVTGHPVPKFFVDENVTIVSGDHANETGVTSGYTYTSAGYVYHVALDSDGSNVDCTEDQLSATPLE